MRLSDGSHVITSFYLVYPEPSKTLAHQGCGTVAQTTEYSWRLVTRGVMMLLSVLVAELALLHAHETAAEDSVCEI